MIPSVIGFLTGICSLQAFSMIPSKAFMLGLLLWVLVLCVWVYYKNNHQHKNKFLKLHWIVIMLAYALGLLWVSLHAQWHFDKQLPEELQGRPLTIVGTIASIPEFNEGSARFEFAIEHANQWRPAGRVQLTWRQYSKQTHRKPQVGDQFQLTVKLKRPRSYANPGSFDSERHFFQNRLQAQGTVIEAIFQNAGYRPIDSLRSKIRDILDKQLKGRPMSGLITALVVGIKNGIQEAQWTVFRDTGTAHLMAISGLHVGLVASFTFFVMVFFWSRLPSRLLMIPAPWVGAVAAVSAALFYALLAGFAVPTQRSVLMVTLFMMGFLTKRVISPWRSYFLALGLVLLWDPLSTLSIGFWLSFGAVGIILYGMRGRLKPKGLWWKWGRAQWVVFLGLIPISLAAFQQMSLVSPLANLIAIPWVSLLVVPMALVGTLLLLCGLSIGGLILIFAEQLLAWMWPFLEWLAHVPTATWMNGVATPWTLSLAMIGVLLLLAPKGFPGRWVGLIWTLPLFLSTAPTVPEGTARVTVLDVGQGLSTVVETMHHTLVFDTGPKLSKHFDTGDRVVIPFLATRGRRQIDTLVISHGDNDHSGGAQSIIARSHVLEILTSEPALFPDRNPKMCWVGHQWTWDHVHFEILHPETVHTKKRNDHSCVLRVQAGNQSVLITGDIEAKSEKKMILRGKEKLASTFLIVPHHGSKTSSSLEFINLVAPEYAIIPVGYRNQYGHPKAEIVKRYQDKNIKLLDTVHDGAITFLLQDTANGSTVPERYRIDKRHYWTAR